MASDQLRVALIGYGHGGEVFHAPLISCTPGMRLAAIVTNNPERRVHAQTAFPSAALLAAPEELWRQADAYDLVVVTTPNRFHVPLGIAAMRAGLPVVIDKPLAATVADVEKLIAVSRETGQLLSVFQNARWEGLFLTARRILEDGLLGPIAHIESRHERYRPARRVNAWRELADPQDAGGLLYDLGSHLIDQAVLLCGFPTHVYAEMPQRRPGAQVDDDTFLSLHFANGVYAHLWMSAVVRLPAARFRMVGLRGVYEKQSVDPQEEALRAGVRPGDPTWGKEPRANWGQLATEINGLPFVGAIETLPGAYEQYYALMRDAILTGSAPPVDPLDALKTTKIIEAAQQSTRQRTAIALPQ